MPRVIFIPGLPGSEIRERQPNGQLTKIFPPRLNQVLPALSGSVKRKLKAPDLLDPANADRMERGEPVRVAGRFLGFDLMKQAKTLYELLKDIGVAEADIVKFGWDWRRPVTDDQLSTSAVTELTALLAGLPQPIPVIVHSTGGLLLRHVLATNPQLRSKVEVVVAFGVPWLGTLKPLAVLAGQQGFGPIKPSDAQAVFASCWAALDLLPRATGANLTVDAQGNEVDLVADTGWTARIPNDANNAMADRIIERAHHSLAHFGTPSANWGMGVEVINIVGWGKKTLVQAVRNAQQRLRFVPSGFDNEASEQQEDLHPGRNEAHYAGDGTVPFASANALTGARVTTLHIPIGALRKVNLSNRRHSELWRNPLGRQVLQRVLVAGTPPAPNTIAAVDWTDKLNPGNRVRLRYVMQDHKGRPLPGAAPRVINTTTGNDVQLPLEADGRGFRELPRGLFRRTAVFRRVQVQLTWNGDPTPKPHSMFIEP